MPEALFCFTSNRIEIHPCYDNQHNFHARTFDSYLSRWLEEKSQHAGIREYLESTGSLVIRSAYARIKTRGKQTQ